MVRVGLRAIRSVAAGVQLMQRYSHPVFGRWYDLMVAPACNGHSPVPALLSGSPTSSTGTEDGRLRCDTS